MNTETLKNSMDLSIVIVSFNTKDITLAAIESIIKNTKGIKYEILVVDNNSNDGSIESLENLKEVKLIQNKNNNGFAVANNQGLQFSKGDFVLFLNSDTLIYDNVLSEMVTWMKKNSDAGVASCCLKNEDGSIQGTGGYFPTLLSVFSWMTIQDIPFVDALIKPFHPHHSKSFFARGEEFYKIKRELDWVTGAFLMTKRDILLKLNGWDESFFMYVEEVDLCYRIKKEGYKVWYLPEWSIIHLGGASNKTKEFSIINEYQGVKKFYLKHFNKWQYNVLRILLLVGIVGRIILFGILEGLDSAKIYAKAIKTI